MLNLRKKYYNKTTIRKSYENFSGLLQLVSTIPGVIIKYHLFNDNVDIYFPKNNSRNSNKENVIHTLYEDYSITFK